MALTWPLGLALALALAPALWLARRAGGRAIDHPLWFLVPARGVARRSRGGVGGRHALLLAAIALAALAASGPVWRARAGDRVLVVDLSATRALDLAAIRARAAGYDRVVLAAPDAAPRIVPAGAAAAAIVPSRGTTDAATLATAVAAGLTGARVVDVAAAPPVGADVGIAAARFHRDPLAPARGWLVVELSDPAGACDRTIELVGRDRAPVRITPWCGGGRGVAVWPYVGQGDETLALRLDPPGRDPLPVDDAATVAIPSLAPTPVWIAPALASSDVARAIAALPTVTQVAAPGPDVVAVVAADSAAAPARARLVLHAPPPSAGAAPLVLADRAPLPGLTPALLAATRPPTVAADAGVDVDPAHVWLRAGAEPAVWSTADATHLAAAIDGAALPVLLADLFAIAPLAWDAPPALVADVRAPPPPPAVRPAGSAARPWPIAACFAIAAAALALEALLARPRRAGLVLRLATLAVIVAGGRCASAPAPRRVVFVLDVSSSVGEAEARAALARRARALTEDDRAALVLVAGGAAIAVPLGAPSAVAAWAGRGPVDAAAAGLDPATTDLMAGAQLAGTLAAPGDAVVLIGDGRDRRGAAALAGAPGLIGRAVEQLPIDDGDLGRIEARSATVRAAPGAAIALAVAVELRTRAAVTIVAAHRGVEVGRIATPLAAGVSVVAVPVTLAGAGVADVALTLAVPGDPIAASDVAHVTVELGGAARRLVITAATVGAVHATTLAGVAELVLDDVPATALTAAAIAALDDFVRAGGTLVWTAGPATAAGGAGALERLLPLRSPPPPRLALMLLIDRSGSIGAPGTGAVAAGPAEVAAAAALEPRDYVGALAFDVAPIAWVAFGPVGDGAVVRDLPPPRGGTDPTAAIRRATDQLAAAPADARAVIALVSDGGFPATVDAAVAAAAAAAARGVRVEAFATGAVDAAGAERLCRVAAAGGGACHAAASALALLRVAPAPPTSAAPLRVRGAASPPGDEIVAQHLALAPTADATVLVDAGADPLLAVRAHGAGRVVGWASDRAGGWVDAAVAGALIDAAIARPSSAAIAVRPVDDRLEVEVRDDAVPGAPALAAASAAAGSAALVLTPAPPGRAIGRVAISGRVEIAIAGATATYVAPDPERRGLGAARSVFPSSRAPAAVARRPNPVAPWLAGLSILLMLATLSLPERSLVTTTHIDDDGRS